MAKWERAVLLVDVSNLVARYTHVHKRLTSPSGKFTGGVYGAVEGIRGVLTREMNGDACGIILCHDNGTPAFRKKLCPEYKENRKDNRKRNKSSQDFHEKLIDQLNALPEVSRSLGIFDARAIGFEADDIAAFLVRYVLKKHRILLFSGDRDWSQLTDGKRVGHFIPNYGVVERVPKTFLLARALKGDSADNIKGVPGIGEKSATRLLINHPFRKPDDFIAALSEDDRIEKKVLDNQDKLRAAYKAMNLRLSAKKIAKRIEKVVRITRNEPNAKEFKRVCKRLGMNSYLALITSAMQPFVRSWETAEEKLLWKKICSQLPPTCTSTTSESTPKRTRRRG